MDISHQWGSDLSLSANGDLAISDGVKYVQERALRRLMTTAMDDIFNPAYGAGLPGFVGELIDVGRISSLIRSQLMMEQNISLNPEPVIEIAADDLGTVLCAITLSMIDGQEIGMSFGMKETL